MLLRLTFAAWRLVTSLTETASLKADNERMTEMLGKKAHSLWTMRKEDLIETARKELGMSRAQAEKETVVTLRERIRRERSVAVEQADPLLILPKGLESMKADDLAQECIKRGLDVSPLPGQRGARKTRPQMILMIREYVELQSSSSQAAAASPTEAVPRPRPSTSPNLQVAGGEEEGWDHMSDL